MKKNILFGLIVAAFIFSGCKSSIEKDAKEIADITCESFSAYNLSEDDSKMEKLRERAEKLEKKFADKYPPDSENEKKLEELVKDNLKDCDAYKSMMDIMENMGGAMENLEDKFEGAFEDLGDEFKKAMDDWGENLEDVLDGLGDKLEKTFNFDE